LTGNIAPVCVGCSNADVGSTAQLREAVRNVLKPP